MRTNKHIAPPAGTASIPGQSAGPSYRAVEVRCSSRACAAAKLASERRFLIGEAPRLPLALCSRPEKCSCHYRHLDDRRQGPRRASESGLPAQLHLPGAERREQLSRRAEDLGRTAPAPVPVPVPDTLNDDSYYDYQHKKLCD